MNFIKYQSKTFFPSKIICIGRNYAEHAKELNNPVPSEAVIFIKPNSAISQDIVFSEMDEIHYEGEITFLIMGGQIKAVGFGMDLTKRKLQSTLKTKGLPWERAKAFDKSAVFSEFVEVKNDLNDLEMTLHINDQLIQSGSCSAMLFKPEEFLSEVKSFLTLEDGDLLMSGTPKGVGPIHINDRFLGRVYSHKKLLVEKEWTVKL